MENIKFKIAYENRTPAQNFVEFEATSVSKITEDLALKFQAEAGYEPTKHGFTEFKMSRDPVLLRYVATWRCNAVAI